MGLFEDLQGRHMNIPALFCTASILQYSAHRHGTLSRPGADPYKTNGFCSPEVNDRVQIEPCIFTYSNEIWHEVSTYRYLTFKKWCQVGTTCRAVLHPVAYPLGANSRCFAIGRFWSGFLAVMVWTHTNTICGPYVGLKWRWIQKLCLQDCISTFRGSFSEF